MSSSEDRQCNEDYCFAPDTSCSLGNMSFESCPHWKNDSSDEPDQETNTSTALPWTGRALGLADIRFIASSGQPHIVGIIGPADAGKTTLLAMLFLSLYQGHKVGGQAFAGSYSLLGWEAISQCLQLLPGDSIRFPAHTSTQGRIPGLLHLALADFQSRQEILLADAPGEWFSEWGRNQDSSQAEGARWIVERADRVLMVADSAALSGPERGQARNELEFLMQRYKASATDDVALVRTKSDISLNETSWETLKKQFLIHFPEAPVFEISVPGEAAHADVSTLESINSIFTWAFKPRVYKLSKTTPSTTATDPFLNYRFVP